MAEFALLGRVSGKCPVRVGYRSCLDGEKTMEFFDVLNARHSIRAYDSTPVEPGKLEQIFEAIRRAPSAGNLQAYEVYVVCDAGGKSGLARASGDQQFLVEAPVVLVFCAHAALSSGRYGKRGAELYCVQDATIACTFAMLASTALGLSSVWVGAFDEHEVGSVIRAPQAHRPVAILPIGNAAEEPRLRPRRNLADMMHQVS